MARDYAGADTEELKYAMITSSHTPCDSLLTVI
jgi:hypothetical protein